MVNERAHIDHITLYEIEIPYAIPFQISGGVSYTRKSLIVQMQGEGVTAYGESAPFEEPFYSSETIGSARLLLTQLLIPRVTGRTFASIKELNECLSMGVRGNHFAKAGIETAYWDLVARINNLSLQELIALKLREYGTTEAYLKKRDSIESGVSVGIPQDESYSTLAKWVEGYQNHGYRRIKVKVRPGWDIGALEAARKVIGPDFPLWPDANSSFTLSEHLPTLLAMDEFNCLLFEQPLHHDDIYQHALLAKQLKTPICFDESLKSLAAAQAAYEMNASRIWNIKIQRVGGLQEALRIYAYASTVGVPVWGGTMPESGIGAVAITALATFAGFTYAADVEESARWYGPGRDIVEITMSEDGRITPPPGPGIGTVDEKRLQQLCVK